MKPQKGKTFLIYLGIAIIVIILIVIFFKGDSKKTAKTENTKVEEIEKYTTKIDEETRINTSSEFNKDKKYKDLEITNIQFTYQNGKSVLLANVKNTGRTKHESEIVKATIIGENNEILDELEPIIPTIEVGEVKQLNIIISGASGVNAKDFKIEPK